MTSSDMKLLRQEKRVVETRLCVPFACQYLLGSNGQCTTGRCIELLKRAVLLSHLLHNCFKQVATRIGLCNNNGLIPAQLDIHNNANNFSLSGRLSPFFVPHLGDR